MGKGRDSLHFSEGEMDSSLPKQLVSQIDTFSISPAAVPVLSTHLIAGSDRLHHPLHKTVGIIGIPDLLVERSSNSVEGMVEGSVTSISVTVRVTVQSHRASGYFSVVSVMCGFIYVIV